jgi:predicted nucleotidyltransferase
VTGSLDACAELLTSGWQGYGFETAQGLRHAGAPDGTQFGPLERFIGIHTCRPHPGKCVQRTSWPDRLLRFEERLGPAEICYTARMDRAAAIAKLKEHETELKQLGVEHLYLFGSTARGEAHEDSDIDLFFDHPLGSLGLFELMEVKDAAARILGRTTDIMTRRSLHPVLRERIEASALQVF